MNENTPTKEQTKRAGTWMVLVMWLLLLGLLTLAFNKWDAKRHNPNQNVASLIDAQGVREVVLQRNHEGHYVTNGYINGQPVVFMIDTGASDVSVPSRLAEQLGLSKGAQVLYQTANGPAVSYATNLDTVSIGDISLEGVRASINPNVRDMDILLGMSFLKNLEFTQRGDTLVLRQF